MKISATFLGIEEVLLVGPRYIHTHMYTHIHLSVIHTHMYTHICMHIYTFIPIHVYTYCKKKRFFLAALATKIWKHDLCSAFKMVIGDFFGR